jgi:hypothetical protein
MVTFTNIWARASRMLPFRALNFVENDISMYGHGVPLRYRSGLCVNNRSAICDLTERTFVILSECILYEQVASVVQWLVCLPLDPKVAGSNPAKTTDI